MASDIVNQINSQQQVNPAVADAVPHQPPVPPTQEAQGGGTATQEQGRNANREPQKPIEEVVDDVNEYVQNIRRTLNFSIEEDLGKTVIKVVDANTDEVVRQIPSEEFVELAKALEKAKGILLHEEV